MKKLKAKTKITKILMIMKGTISTIILDKLSNKGANLVLTFIKKYKSQQSIMMMKIHQSLATFKYSSP